MNGLGFGNDFSDTTYQKHDPWKKKKLSGFKN